LKCKWAQFFQLKKLACSQKLSDMQLMPFSCFDAILKLFCQLSQAASQRNNNVCVHCIIRMGNQHICLIKVIFGSSTGTEYLPRMRGVLSSSPGRTKNLSQHELIIMRQKSRRKEMCSRNYTNTKWWEIKQNIQKALQNFDFEIRNSTYDMCML